MPVFQQNDALKEIGLGPAGGRSPMTGTAMTQNLDRLQDAGYIRRIPDRGQATLEIYPYLKPLFPGRPKRKYLCITETGIDRFFDEFSEMISMSDEGRNIRDIMRPDSLARFIASHPKIQAAIWEGITGFSTDEIPPLEEVDIPPILEGPSPQRVETIPHSSPAQPVEPSVEQC